MRKVSQRTYAYAWQIPVAVMFFLIFFSDNLPANPEGDISTTAVTKVHQASPKIAFNWHNLSISLNKTNRFGISHTLERLLTTAHQHADENSLISLTQSDIQNNKLIAVHLGTVILTSGKSITMDFLGEQLVYFVINDKVTSAEIGVNGQTLSSNTRQGNSTPTDDKTILVSAKTAQRMLDQAIYMGDVSEAHSVSVQNGEIILVSDVSDAKVAEESAERMLASADQILWPSSVPNAESHTDSNDKLIEKTGTQSHALPMIAQKKHGTAVSNRTQSDTAGIPIPDLVLDSISHRTHSMVSAQPEAQSISIIHQRQTAYWSNNLIIILTLLAAVTAALLLNRQRKLRVAQNMTASPARPQTVLNMRRSVTEISKFARLIAGESSGEVDGPWKDYVDHLVANSTNIQDIIRHIQNQSVAENSATTAVMTELRNALKDIMDSAELMKQNPHMYRKSTQQYTQVIVSDVRKILEQTEKF